jgi:DNA-binding transcriptional LysR family regulator
LARTSRASEGEIKIASPEGVATLWLPRFYPWFMKKYDRVSVNVAPVDYTRDDQTDRFDSVLQLIEPTAQDVISTRVATLHYIPYASDSYIRKFGKPKTRQDLLKHRLLDLSAYVVGLGDWVKWVGDERIRQNRVLSTDFTATFISAMRNGMGIGLLPTYVSCTRSGQSCGCAHQTSVR